MLEFELPWAFALLAAPLFVIWLVPEFRDESEAVRTPFFQLLASLTGTQPKEGAVVVRKGIWQKAFHVIGWSLIVTALAAPVWVGDPILQHRPARDLMLIVDLSGSMEESDFTRADGSLATRLDAVKDVLGSFIARRENDRLALAAFGTAAYLQSPLRKIVKSSKRY